MAILAVYLRQRGSPESKPVGAPHTSTGVEGQAQPGDEVGSDSAPAVQSFFLSLRVPPVRLLVLVLPVGGCSPSRGSSRFS